MEVEEEVWAYWPVVIGAVVGGVIFTAAYVLLTMFPALSAPPSAAARDVAATQEGDPPELRDFTPAQLAACCTGEQRYLSIKGEVLDVSSNPSMYGEGGPYSLFVGHDCSYNLATLSFEEKDLDRPIASLSPGELETLDEWFEKLKHVKRYPVVGRLSEPTIYDGPLSHSELRDLQARSLTATAGHRVHPPLLVGLLGHVYDVGYGGFDHYGPNGPYHRFCGRDASRALAKMSFEPQDLDEPHVDDLAENHRKTLQDWVQLFDKKYPKVATLQA